MIMLIVTGAAILSSSIAYLRVPQTLVAVLGALNLPKYLILAIICIIYLGLGCLFDGVSMMVLTLPIVFPLITALGFDPIWFGIVLTVLIETAQITPPVGFNLYVLQTISGHSINTIVRSTIPFFLIMLLMVVILVFIPKLPLILPNLMISLSQ
jgi:TRAP-type C4-dicarboxylate transport system permease large subunit